MKRNVSLDEISDGKLYGANDLVKTDCNGCSGCFSCCQGMGQSIVLDPLDLYRMETYTGKSFLKLMEREIELHVVDGMVLPNIKMGAESDRCPFLNQEGRCSIHPVRPGVCRLFPLGRYYEKGSFRYFLQIHECTKEHKTKIKVRKWVDMPDFKAYEKFAADWHYFCEDTGEFLNQVKQEGERKEISMFLLNCFYLEPYPSEQQFYETFYGRMEKAVRVLAQKEGN